MVVLRYYFEGKCAKFALSKILDSDRQTPLIGAVVEGEGNRTPMSLNEDCEFSLKVARMLVNLKANYILYRY